MKKIEVLKMITFITGNKHKVNEARRIFQDYHIKMEHIDLGYTEPQGTLEDVAKFGAKYASEKLEKAVIVEDAGLFIKTLNGFPGTYSSYVQETLGNDGILKLMENVTDRYAEFRSVIGYCTPKAEPKTFLGKVSGQIALEERGSYGFAYDPLFLVEDRDKTFGELTIDEKSAFSHRKNSLKEFSKWYKDQL